MRVRPSALILENNKVLLLHYNYGGVDVYAIPGGSPEQLETLEEANVRELKEELSVSIESGELILVCESCSGPKGEIVLHTVFSSTIASGVPLVNPDNTSSLGFVWMDANTLSELNMYPNVGKKLLEVINGGPGSYGAYAGKVDQRWYG